MVTPDAQGNFTLTGVREVGLSYFTARDTSVVTTSTRASTGSATTSTPTYSPSTLAPAGATVTGVAVGPRPRHGSARHRDRHVRQPAREHRLERLRVPPRRGRLVRRAGRPAAHRRRRPDVGAHGGRQDLPGLLLRRLVRRRAGRPSNRFADRCWDGWATTCSETRGTGFTVHSHRPLRPLGATVALCRAPASPSAPVEPFVTGSPAVGGSLTVDPGTWVPWAALPSATSGFRCGQRPAGLIAIPGRDERHVGADV